MTNTCTSPTVEAPGGREALRSKGPCGYDCRLGPHLQAELAVWLEEGPAVHVPGYAPDLNPVEGLWAHIKRSLANLAARTLSQLETLLRRRLKTLQYRHGVLDGFLAGTTLALDRPDGP